MRLILSTREPSPPLCDCDGCRPLPTLMPSSRSTELARLMPPGDRGRGVLPLEKAE